MLEEVEDINNLRVYYDSLLFFDKHMNEKISKVYIILRIIKRNFIHFSRNCFVAVYKSVVRSHLEHANSVHGIAEEKRILIHWNEYR